MKRTRTLLCPLVLALLVLAGTGSSANAQPRQDGLILWLDAADASSLKTNQEGLLTQIHDKSGKAHHAVTKQAPMVVENALGGHPVLRFDGSGSLTVPNLLKDSHQATVFVVFRRSEDQVSDQAWQKVLASSTKEDGLTLHTGANSEALSTRVLRASYHGIKGGDLFIGKGSPGGRPILHGDIAEILVYTSDFYVESQMREVVTYLEKKWGFTEDRENDWTHVGPLPESPKRLNDTLPLSDQANTGGWTRHDPMWDEFEGSELDDTKWWDHNPDWYGRPPGRFLAREVDVRDSELQITMRRDPSLPVEKLYKSGDDYHTYSSGTIKSKSYVRYGYFEIEAMPMASAGSSAWWFTGNSWDVEEKGRHSQEIDVFELGGGSSGRENIYSMNLHIFQTPQAKQHWNRGGEWDAPFHFADNFHVYGLEWTPEHIRYFVDGVLVRSVRNDAWHAPMQMLFDSETMFSWLGEPKAEDLPSVFRVRYVRAWTNDVTGVEWRDRYQVKDPTKPTRISKYARKFEKVPE